MPSRCGAGRGAGVRGAGAGGRELSWRFIPFEGFGVLPDGRFLRCAFTVSRGARPPEGLHGPGTGPNGPLRAGT
ncbi:hypothetical protein GCM10010423_05040 [Streptomyces levis]|uniref:Uncharacterized protein n=1 Tax=Streptomyces levis TaxID=285566 RepID=A0ABN3N8G2_9ACTN